MSLNGFLSGEKLLGDFCVKACMLCVGGSVVRVRECVHVCLRVCECGRKINVLNPSIGL